jgi:hypothetical protein
MSLNLILFYHRSAKNKLYSVEGYFFQCLFCHGQKGSSDILDESFEDLCSAQLKMNDFLPLPYYHMQHCLYKMGHGCQTISSTQDASQDAPNCIETVMDYSDSTGYRMWGVGRCRG